MMGSGASTVEAARLDGPEPDLRGPEQREPDLTGPEQREPDLRGPEQREPDLTGPEQREPDQRGPEQREPNQRGPEQREPDLRGPEQREPDLTGPEQREPDLRRSEPRDLEQGDPDHREPEQTEPEQRELDQAAAPAASGEEAGQLDDNPTVDALSLWTEKDEDEEERCPPTEVAVEGGEVSLDFESFLHDSGTLYSCFLHHGRRVYVDEHQNLQPFPKAWCSEGRFLDIRSEDSGLLQTPPTNQLAVTEDERASSIYIHGRGTVMTYMFEEKRNVCRFWDPQSGVWLLLPLQWEKDVDFVFHRIQCVMSALPGLQDQTEVTAALRQCNYDPEEVVSAYLTMFGDVLLQAAASGDYEAATSFRVQLERERVVEDLQQNLEQKQTEVAQLLQKNQQLLAEVRYRDDIVQHLNHKMVELETDRQESQEKLRALLRRRAPPPPPATPAKPSVDPERLRCARHLARHLSVGTKHLRSSVEQEVGGLRQQLEQLSVAVGGVARAQQEAERDAQQLRSLYRKETLHRRSLHNKLLELQGNIRVFCRCRGSPASGSASCLEETHDQEVVVVHKESKKKFHFDKVFPPTSTQEDVFEGILPLITSCVDGYNACILAYGQTGSGKTFTMMGSRENPGVNIRSIRELLRLCAEKEEVSHTLKVSMLEIYLDTLNDLLANGTGAALELRVQGKRVWVPGLTWVPVQTEEDIIGAMETGEKNRKMASTKMNIHSSRSHLLVALEVCSSDQVSGLKTCSTLTLCDLAGSERIFKTEAEGQRLVEAAAINKSLTALAQVFGALRSNALHVPFRNSKLTHLLQPSLSGDAKCCVFVNVSPEAKDAPETLSTLQFGSSVRQVTLGKAPRQVAHAGGRRQGGGRSLQRDL